MACELRNISKKAPIGEYDMHRKENSGNGALTKYYLFHQKDGTHKEISMEPTDNFIRTLDSNQYAWTYFDRWQCSCCSLDATKTTRCPAAVSVAFFLHNFGEHRAVDRIVIAAIDGVDRHTVWKTDLQNALAVLVRTAMFYSSCPVMEKFRPVVIDLPPMATFKELWKYLVLKYLLKFKGEKEKACEYVESLFSDFHNVNQILAQKIRKGIKRGAIVNSLVLFDSRALGLELFFDDICDDIENAILQMSTDYHARKNYRDRRRTSFWP